MSKKQTRPLALVFLSLILALGLRMFAVLSGGQQMDASSPGEAQTSSKIFPPIPGRPIRFWREMSRTSRRRI